MKVFTLIRDRWHPLHRARQWRWFQRLLYEWDPMVTAKIPHFQKPVYVRLFAHASLLLAQEGLEEGVRQTFTAWMTSTDGRKGFWDVGANIGLFSFTYGSVHPDASLISFEPDHRNLQCLRRTMSVWNLPSHRLVPAAVSDYTGQASFKIDRLSGATGTLMEADRTFNERHYAAKTRTEEVNVVRLDDFYDPKAPPGLVKIDVEGAELAVLHGARQLLSEAAPVLLFESFGREQECRSLVAPHNYSLFDADRLSSSSTKTTNFLALNVEKVAPDLIFGFRELGYPM